jgi:hypothetical protein
MLSRFRRQLKGLPMARVPRMLETPPLGASSELREEGLPAMRRSVIALTLGLSAGIVTAPAAFADTPDSPNCLGVVTAQRAVAHHDIGDHASSQEEPRLGLGNVTRLLLGDDAHIGDLGALLGEIDEDAATSCP